MTPTDRRGLVEQVFIAAFKSLMAGGMSEDEIIDELRGVCRYELYRLAKLARAEFDSDRRSVDDSGK